MRNFGGTRRSPIQSNLSLVKEMFIMAVESYSEEFGHFDPLVISSSVEMGTTTLTPEIEAQSTNVIRLFGSEAVGRTTRLVDYSESEFDGAEQPFYRGVRVKASNLNVTHSHLS